jgi:hypothetical protein
MNFLLFVLEILFVVTVIALVPARPELSPARVIHNEQLSDEALEVACGELMHGSPALAYGSYCFTCRPHFVLRTAPDTLI